MRALDPDRSIVSIVEAPRKPGDGSPGPGRPKGQPNRNTATMRFMLDQIVAGQLHNVDAALRDVLQGKPPVYDAITGKLIQKGIEPNPKAYLDAFMGLLDFNLPRLTRVEVKDDRTPLGSVEIPEGATQEDAARAYLTLVKG